MILGAPIDVFYAREPLSKFKKKPEQKRQQKSRPSVQKTTQSEKTPESAKTSKSSLSAKSKTGKAPPKKVTWEMD